MLGLSPLLISIQLRLLFCAKACCFLVFASSTSASLPMLDIPPNGGTDDFYKQGQPQMAEMFKANRDKSGVVTQWNSLVLNDGKPSKIISPEWIFGKGNPLPKGYNGQGFYHHQTNTPKGFGGYFALYFAGFVSFDDFQNQPVGYSFDFGLNLNLQGPGKKVTQTPLALGGIIVEQAGVKSVQFRATFGNETPVELSTLTLGLTPENQQLLVGKFLFGKDGQGKGTHSFEAALNPFSSDELLGIDIAGVEWTMVKDGLNNSAYSIENMFTQTKGSGGSVTFDDLVIAKRFSGVGYVKLDSSIGIVPIPEPRVYALGGIGFLALLIGGRRLWNRRKTADAEQQIPAA